METALPVKLSLSARRWVNGGIAAVSTNVWAYKPMSHNTVSPVISSAVKLLSAAPMADHGAREISGSTATKSAMVIASETTALHDLRLHSATAIITAA